LWYPYCEASEHGIALVSAGKVFFKRQFPSTYEAMTGALQGALTALEERGWIASEEEFYARLCLARKRHQAR
jgi:hypothetical protein